MDIEKRKLEYEQWWEDHVDEQMYYIAHLLEKREEKELIEIERKAEAGELPKPSPEFHDSIMKIAQDADKKICRKRLQKLGRRCAIFFICFVIVGSVATASGDAWKNAFTNLFPKDKDDYITLYPFNVDELDDWSNYYIFSDIPENFSLVYAEDFETDKSIVF